MTLEDLGGGAPRGVAESELRLKIIESPYENKGFHRSWGVSHGTLPQNLSLEWPSVWGGKSLKFLRKMKDSRGPGG